MHPLGDCHEISYFYEYIMSVKVLINVEGITYTPLKGYFEVRKTQLTLATTPN